MNNTSDLDQFSAWFDVLAVTHRLQASDDIRGKMKGEYFDVLRDYPREAVEYAYQSLRRKMKKWPVPADWLEALPPYGNVNRLPLASREELAATAEAEALGYEREHICQCAACVAANCFHPPRYVPLMDGDNLVERRHPTKQGRPVILGRWIHGVELKRWYAARAQFYELKNKLGIDLDLERQARQDIRTRVDGLTRLAAAKIAGNAAPKSE